MRLQLTDRFCASAKATAVQTDYFDATMPGHIDMNSKLSKQGEPRCCASPEAPCGCSPLPSLLGAFHSPEAPTCQATRNEQRGSYTKLHIR
jgi:hypothetical protein